MSVVGRALSYFTVGPWRFWDSGFRRVKSTGSEKAMQRADVADLEPVVTSHGPFAHSEQGLGAGCTHRSGPSAPVGASPWLIAGGEKGQASPSDFAHSTASPTDPWVHSSPPFVLY